MGMEEDRIELTGTDYERKLFDLKKGYVDLFLVEVSSGRWEFSRARPVPGRGKFIERMPNGECRLWTNINDADTAYTLV